MPKNIVFCADGTWDTPVDQTNVLRLYRALVHDPGQTIAYDDGVGSDGTPLQQLAGGGLGDGLLKKIQDGYTQIAHVYEAGDRIFIFGFSRGAYTARSLAGMIAVCGLPTRNFDDNLVQTAFNAYRTPALRPGLAAALQNYAIDDAKITMVGVWDTVGSLGIPALFGGIEKDYQFLDTTLHPDVLNAYHAVSIDEKRAEFPATLWTGAPIPGQTVVQVYFAGVHCDVGGGYPDDTSLADITLRWMVKTASNLGLLFDDDVIDGLMAPIEDQCALMTLHQSWDVFWGIPRRRTIAGDPRLADSVLIRAAYDPTYRPSNLNLDANGRPQGPFTAYPAMGQ